ncbi:hypothetical protein L248_2219 [Schleiferilactobacillus shenzhenensis LY-73]|uniref:ABC transporter ATP-binding protein n=2 Tax=Schleiferilactobacillus shenzhenensis TaxID=1231337 RepID=U4TK52_9LACO|nr:hypothetical protein L248_2219 [Schleiferilactobacillus shenzhenensis LY-73]
MRFAAYLLLVPLAALCEVALSWVLQIITDVVTGKQHLPYLWLSVGILLYLLGKSATYFAQSFQRSRLLAQGSRLLRDDLYAATSQRSFAQFGSQNHGFYLAKFNKEVEIIENNYYGTSLRAYYLAWQLLIALAGTIFISPWVTLAIILLCIPSMAMPFLSQKQSEHAQTQVVAATTHYNDRVDDFINGFSTLRLNATGSRFGDLFAQAADRLAQKEIHNQLVIKLVGQFLNLFNDLQYVGTWLLGGFLVLRGTITLGQPVAFSQLMVFISNPLFQAADLLSTFYGGRAVVQKVQKYLDRTTVSTPKAKLHPAIHTIQFHDVGLHVDDTPLLQHIDLLLQTSRKYIIVGQSGSGKSTLVRQLFGYYAAASGTITIDGYNIHDLAFADIADHLTYVDQTTYLFNATLQDNVTVFHDVPETQTRTALTEAGLQKLLTADSAGLHRQLSNRSTAISGGERQRLALARNRLRQPLFTIYDELTSGLDPAIAATIENTLFAAAGGLVFITHRFNQPIFEKADEIIVIDQGRILSRGPYTDNTVRHALDGLGLVPAATTVDDHS